MANENDTNQPATTPETPNQTPAPPDNANQLPEFPPNEFVRGDFGEIKEPSPVIKRRD
jgi:hypothetical protein